MPVSALVVGNESLNLVIYLLVSQEYAFDPCYLGKMERDEKIHLKNGPKVRPI